MQTLGMAFRREASEDGGALFDALAARGLAIDELRGLLRVDRATACQLWDAFITKSARHGMLVPANTWPNARGEPIALPLPPSMREASAWLVFWMRERAALVSGAELEARLDDILMEDDEAVIAINTDTLDTLQSWGGHCQWITMKRPSPR